MSKRFYYFNNIIISSFDISVAFPYPNIFLCIPAFATDAAAVSPKGIKTL